MLLSGRRPLNCFLMLFTELFLQGLQGDKQAGDDEQQCDGPDQHAAECAYA